MLFKELVTLQNAWKWTLQVTGTLFWYWQRTFCLRINLMIPKPFLKVTPIPWEEIERPNCRLLPHIVDNMGRKEVPRWKRTIGSLPYLLSMLTLRQL